MTTIEFKIDPEPWLHRWPNDEKGVRSANEKCTVDGCVVDFEPRSEAQLIKDYNSKPFWFIRLRRKIRAGIAWLRRDA